ncbi:MAG: Abi family protein [Arcobacteraceae bacterium]|jgi:abortive infection bacteriophage resistance protein|nr:Abi family protein [Arcobacteraceae bacterium]
MITYRKPHLSYQEQVQLLKSRKLIINDEAYATQKLIHISYYRLSAYFIPFYSEKNTFKDNITFDDIIELYHFDKELRILTFNAIEKIEIFLRASISHNFSKEHTPFGYIESKNLCCTNEELKILYDEIKKETNRSKETFVKHFRETYTQNDLPIWMVVETISFGTLSKLYTMLCPKTEKLVLNNINLPSFVFKNWLHVFSYIRNISAHHSRLWNRQFVIKAKIPKHKSQFSGIMNDKYYTFAIMTHYILNAINDTFNFKQELKNLFDKFPNIDKNAMGFPNDWENMDIWN